MAIDIEEFLRIPGLADALGYDFVSWAGWALNGEITDLDDFAVQWNKHVDNLAKLTDYRSGQGFNYTWSLWKTPDGVMIGGPDLLLPGGGGPYWVVTYRGVGDYELVHRTAPMAYDVFANEDEPAVALIMGRELGFDPDTIEVTFTNAVAAQVEIHRESYTLFASDEAVHDAAVERVTADLEDDENRLHFNRDFLLRHIDEKKLKREVTEMAKESAVSYIEDLDAEDKRDALQRADLLPEEAEDNEDWEPSDALLDQLADSMAEDQASDPMRYLSDMMGNDDAYKWAMDNVGIDVEEAAKDAVNTDGPGHFLNSYDGEVKETDPSDVGGVSLPYIRE